MIPEMRQLGPRRLLWRGKDRGTKRTRWPSTEGVGGAVKDARRFWLGTGGRGGVTHHHSNSYRLLGPRGLARLPLTLQQEGGHHFGLGKRGVGWDSLRARTGGGRWAGRALQDLLQEL